MDAAPPAVHPSAVVSPRAKLAPGVRVGPFVVIEEDVEVGDASELLVGTVLHAGSRVGAGCRLGPHAVVGGVPMDTRFRGERSYAVLEDGVQLREFTTVHRATGEEAETRVGARTLVMSYAHVSHNGRVGREVVLTTGVQLGGHAHVGDYATLGSYALVHQFCRIGAYAMFGAGSGTNQDVLPFTMARGNPARHYRLNKVGLERRGVTGERYQGLERALRALRRRDRQALDELAEASEDARLLRDFVASSGRGVARFVKG